MSATTVIRHLLAGSAAVTGAVPAGRIRLGILPLGTRLPAIGITSVSGVPRNTLSMAEPQRLVRERVQITLYAANYPDLDRVMWLVAGAEGNRRETIAGLVVRSIVPSTIGPDLEYIDPVIFARSADFHVSYLQ